MLLSIIGNNDSQLTLSMGPNMANISAIVLNLVDALAV